MMALVIGITGGIGSGKSYVASLLEAKGFKVYYADDQSKHILQEDSGIHAKILNLFGSEVMGPDGKPDRKKIGARVFGNDELLKQLNAILHPAVLADHAEWVNAHPDEKILFKEAAILFEAGSDKGCDAVMLVYAPKEVRLRRVCNRDGMKEEEVLARMARQWPEEEKIRRSDYILFNDGMHPVGDQLEAALAYFLKKSGH